MLLDIIFCTLKEFHIPYWLLWGWLLPLKLLTVTVLRLELDSPSNNKLISLHKRVWPSASVCRQVGHPVCSAGPSAGVTGAGLGLEVKHELGVVSAWRGHVIGHISPCTVQAVVGVAVEATIQMQMSRPHGLELLSPGGPGSLLVAYSLQTGSLMRTHSLPSPNGTRSLATVVLSETTLSIGVWSSAFCVACGGAGV